MQAVDFYKQPLACIPFSGLWEHSHAFTFLWFFFIRNKCANKYLFVPQFPHL